jgi:hypothetical protein
LVDKKLFKKAEKKIARSGKKRHAAAERSGHVTERIKGQRYRLDYKIRKLRG